MTDPIVDALDRFVPPFEDAAGDWRGILNAATKATRVADRQSRHLRLQRRRRPLVVAALLLATMAIGTAAVAVALGAFNGIGAAQHPRTSSDVIDPATAAYMKSHLVGIQLDTARRIGQLPDGNSIYVVTGSQNDLCTVVGPTNAETWCGAPLSQAHPATIFDYGTGSSDPAKRFITFGIAIDGVTSVSFQYSTQQGDQMLGPAVTAPVNDNLWSYQNKKASPPTLLQPVTAHFADGTTVTEPATGTNCAAC